jgi:CubicO group peptidase (beta-lactamase class C family)
MIVLLNQGRSADGRAILSREAMTLTFADHDPGAGGYGLGLFVSKGGISETRGSFWHSGLHAGARAFIRASPQRDQGFVVMINSKAKSGTGLLTEIRKALECAYGWTACT